MKKTIAFIALIFICWSANATVNFRNANIILSPPGGIYVDINNDGTNDFLFSAITTNPNTLKIKGVSAGSKMYTDGIGHVVGLNDSVLVGSNFPVNTWADSSIIYRWDGGIYPFAAETWRHIGFQISYNGGVHYGYIYMYFSMLQSIGTSQILWIAYEETPGWSIKCASQISVGTSQLDDAQFQVSQSTDAIQFRFGKQMRGQLSLYDITGHAVYHAAVSGESKELSTAALPAGVYLASFVSGNRRLTRKFVVQH